MGRCWVLLFVLAACGRLRFGLLPGDGDGGDTGGSADAEDTCLFHAIDAGDRGSCAIDKTDSVWCWGANDLGQIVVGGPSPILTPTKIALPGPVAQVRVGSDFACAR